MSQTNFTVSRKSSLKSIPINGQSNLIHRITLAEQIKKPNEINKLPKTRTSQIIRNGTFGNGSIFSHKSRKNSPTLSKQKILPNKTNGKVKRDLCYSPQKFNDYSPRPSLKFQNADHLLATIRKSKLGLTVVPINSKRNNLNLDIR